MFHRQIDRAGDKKQQPERRAQIRHHAHPDMEAIGKIDARREQKPEVLQIAQAPPAVTPQAVVQVGRTFLVAALLGVGEPHIESCLAHERGLDRVVAEDMPPPRVGFRQFRQIAVLHERAQADDGVVTPVV